MCLSRDFPGRVRVWSLRLQNWGHSYGVLCLSCSAFQKCPISCRIHTGTWVGTVQDQLSLPYTPVTATSRAAPPSAAGLTLWLRLAAGSQSFRSSITWERREEPRLQARVPLPCLEYAESLRKPEGKVFCQLLTDVVEGVGQQETTCGFLNLQCCRGALL